MSPNFNFDQIVINMKSTEWIWYVYFISHENQQVYSSMVQQHPLIKFREDYFGEAKQYNKYFSFKTGSGRMIYLPENETELVSYQYLFKKLPIA